MGGDYSGAKMREGCAGVNGRKIEPGCCREVTTGGENEVVVGEKIPGCT